MGKVYPIISSADRNAACRSLSARGLYLPHPIDLRLAKIPEAERRGQPIQIGDNAPPSMMSLALGEQKSGM